MDCHGFQGSGIWKRVVAFADEMLPLQKPLLDPSWLLFHRFVFDFIVIHGISIISGVGGLETSCGFCGRDVAPKATFARSQFAAIIDSLIYRCVDLSDGGWAGWLAGWLAGRLLAIGSKVF